MKLYVALLCSLLAVPALAHGPTPRKTDQSVLVAAAADAVWQKVAEPCSMAQWHPQVAECAEIEPRKYSLKLRNGGVIVHEIDEIAEDKRALSYRLGSEVDIAAMPVSSLSGRIKVEPEGEGARVSWMARYYRAFTGNEPPEGQDDEAAQQAVDAFAEAGLAGLQEFVTQNVNGK
jgi:mxaD protein